MKTRLTFLSLALYAITLFTMCVATSCQNDDDVKPSKVPQSASAALEQRFPGAVAQWEREGGLYKAEFWFEGDDVDAFFSADGTWVRTERDYHGQLPEPVVNYVKTNYPNHQIDDVDWIERANGEPYFRIELERNNKRDVYLNILPNGTRI